MANNPVLSDSPLQHKTTIKVPFFDVDSMNIVWHGHYLKYFEVARCELLEKLGYGYMAMADSGFQFPIVDVHIKYVQALRFNQDIVVTSTLKEWEYRLKIDYLISDAGDDRRLCVGHTIQAAVDVQTQTLRLECPAEFQKSIAQLLEQAKP